MPATPAQVTEIQRRFAVNRAVLPPLSMVGIGQDVVAVVPAEWGGMKRSGTGTAITLNIAPSKITWWNQEFPDFATQGLYGEGVLPNLATGELIVLRQGVYMLTLAINGTIGAGDDFSFEIYLNDVATGIAITWNASNQTTTFVGSIAGLGYLPTDGNLISVYGRAAANGKQFTPTYGQLSMMRAR